MIIVGKYSNQIIEGGIRTRVTFGETHKTQIVINRLLKIRSLSVSFFSIPPSLKGTEGAKIYT